MLSVSLYGPYFIAHSVFLTVYLHILYKWCIDWAILQNKIRTWRMQFANTQRMQFVNKQRIAKKKTIWSMETVFFYCSYWMKKNPNVIIKYCLMNLSCIILNVFQHIIVLCSLFCFSSSCVSYVASFFGLVLFYCPFDILSRLFP